MKKWLTLTLLVLGLLSVLWLTMVWLIGYKTEQAVRDVLAPANAGATPILVDYQRSWFSAQAITQIDVRDTPLGRWTDVVRFRHIISHGPLVWRSSNTINTIDSMDSSVLSQGLLPVLSHWRTQLDLTTADKENRDLLKSVFMNQQPFHSEIVINYDRLVSYQAHLAALQRDIGPDASFGLERVQLSGQLNPESTKPQAINISATALRISQGDSKLSLPKLKIQLHAGEPIRKLDFSVDNAVLQVAETDEVVSFNLRGGSSYRVAAAAVQGDLKLVLDRFSATRYPLNRLEMNATLSGINAIGLQWVNQLQHRLQDKQAQLDWYGEESELPESRRAMRQLGMEAEMIADELLQVLFYKLLQRGQSRLSYELNVDTGLGELQQQAVLSYAGTERRMELANLMGYGLADWLKLVRGRVQLGMDESMLPVELEPLIDYPLQKQALLQEEGQYRMDLRLTGYDAELNGKVYAYERLAEKINPSLITLFSQPEAPVPSDVMSRIETQGLTDEVLQALEDEQNVSAETLELLRQLKAMNEAVQ